MRTSGEADRGPEEQTASRDGIEEAFAGESNAEQRASLNWCIFIGVFFLINFLIPFKDGNTNSFFTGSTFLFDFFIPI